MDDQYANLTAKYAAKPDGYYDLSRPEMLQFVPEECKSVLEVGCSSGGFGALLKENRSDCEVWGIEPDLTAALVASSRLDHVINAAYSADLLDLHNKSFDAVCFFDVLEHMVNPEKALNECKRLLAENGVVIASIPNILHFYQITKILIEQDWRYEDSGIMDNTHLRFFTKKSILRMFELCGYKVHRLEGIYPSYGLKYTIANAAMFGRLKDWKYVQFAVVARIV